MTPRSLIQETVKRFQAAGVPDPEWDSAALLSHLCHQPAMVLRLDNETALSDVILSEFSDLAEKRCRRIPLQHLLGNTFFFGRPFKTDARALIPRPETEWLCEWALEALSSHAAPHVLDLCCGSGCIGLTIKAEKPQADVVLSDISPQALALAHENSELMNVSVTLHCGDLMEDMRFPPFDMIVSNPPYIPSAQCADLQPEVQMDPLIALDGGSDGLDFYRRIADDAPHHLLPGGILLFELGDQEADQVAGILTASGFEDIHVRPDQRGIQRMILARLSASASLSTKMISEP